MAPDELILRRPDDWHLHLRDGAMMRAVLPFSARVFGRAIVMPNLDPPVATTAAARAYRARIEAALPPDADFTPLMTLYLTDETDPGDLALGFADGIVTAAKLYPAHATTNSAKGVTDIRKLDRVLERMAAIGIPLLIHGEVTDPDIDIFDREAVFLDRVLAPLVTRLPELRIVLEHVTTRAAVAFVEGTGPNLAATITAHHLTINRNALFQGGLRPHLYCLPIAKREEDRLALRRAATSGSAKFFLGTDSAPHLVGDKERDCGCAGIFSAPAAMPVYVRVFEAEDALDRLEAFAAQNGARFYRLPVNTAVLAMRRGTTLIPTEVATEAGPIRPFLAGQRFDWQIA
ncbi:MAG: dihydroorotase [Stellaceae bacterium]